MSGAPLGADAYRVLYRSTGLRGEPIAVSGVVVVPKGDVPAGSRRIVAWAHPTSGIVPRCAPSLAHLIFQQIQGSRDLVRQGYIIAGTDYPGLGTPGPHPYLVGTSEAHAVLDSVRAARAIAGEAAGRRFALWGHSQGGQAVLYGAMLAKTYAPELDLVGVAAAAPATELGKLMNDDLPTPGGKNLLAMTLWSWARVFDAPIASVVDPEAMRHRPFGSIVHRVHLRHAAAAGGGQGVAKAVPPRRQPDRARSVEEAAGGKHRRRPASHDPGIPCPRAPRTTQSIRR